MLFRLLLALWVAGLEYFQVVGWSMGVPKPKNRLLLSLCSDSPTRFIRSRGTMHMRCPDGIGRDIWDWVMATNMNGRISFKEVVAITAMCDTSQVGTERPQYEMVVVVVVIMLFLW